MNNRIGFSEKEAELIKQRYPIVDLENLDIPPVGLSTISSLEYLESAIKFDISNNSETSDFEEILLSIARKIGISKEEK